MKKKLISTLHWKNANRLQGLLLLWERRENEAENEATLYFVKRFNTYDYLGIKESLILSKFQLLDDTQLSYTNWLLNEPSGKGEEECVEMYTDGTWNDKRCNQNHFIVCQF